MVFKIVKKADKVNGMTGKWNKTLPWPPTCSVWNTICLWL